MPFIIFVPPMCVEFIPERIKLPSGKAYTRALVDSDELVWVEVSPDVKDTTPGGGTEPGEGETEDPLT